MECGGNLFTGRLETINFISQIKEKMQNATKRGEAMQVEREVEKNHYFSKCLDYASQINKAERKHLV